MTLKEKYFISSLVIPENYKGKKMLPIQGMFIDYVYIFSDNTVKYKLIDAKRTFKNLNHFKEEYEKHYKIIELMNVNSSLISDLRFYKGSK